MLSLFLSAMVLLVGDSYNGSRRWLSFGPLSFQPSEYAKLAVVVLLASVISNVGDRMKSWKNMFLVLLMTLPVVGLVGTNNLSTAVIILGIAVILILWQIRDFCRLYGWGCQDVVLLESFWE